MRNLPRWSAYGLVLAFTAYTLGCAESATQAEDFEVAASETPRDTSPEADRDALAELVAGNTDFAFDLYRAVCDEHENLFYSPYSISLALAMTYGGARGETEREMAETLHFTLGQEQLHPAFNALDLLLASRGEGARGSDDEGFRLNIANSVWGQSGHPFLPEYLDLLAANYGAGLKLVNFEERPEECRAVINDWVSDQTEGKIDELIPQGLITPATTLVLTNAIYFNAAWETPFPEGATNEDGEFYAAAGETVTVPMMFLSESLPYAAVDGVEAVALPYDGRELSMLVLLPPEDGLAELEEALSAARLSEIVEALGERTVHLHMPRFEFSSQLMLAETLATMGMPSAFAAGAADFSGMDGERYLFISEVVHEAFVAVDEEGTEAAAATAVIVDRASEPVPEEPVEVTLDHPFVFLVRDNHSGAILFVGRVSNPAAGAASQ